jgi:hypothetical protein
LVQKMGDPTTPALETWLPRKDAILDRFPLISLYDRSKAA